MKKMGGTNTDRAGAGGGDDLKHDGKHREENGKREGGQGVVVEGAEWWIRDRLWRKGDPVVLDNMPQQIPGR